MFGFVGARCLDMGQTVETVSNTDLTRTFALVDAKRPDDKGLVRISGARRCDAFVSQSAWHVTDCHG